jgi:hypothetical protein
MTANCAFGVSERVERRALICRSPEPILIRSFGYQATGYEENASRSIRLCFRAVFCQQSINGAHTDPSGWAFFNCRHKTSSRKQSEKV